jgi:hypothetical protein
VVRTNLIGIAVAIAAVALGCLACSQQGSKGLERPSDALAAVSAPTGVGPDIWKKLTAELARVLKVEGTQKRVSAAPTGKGSAPGGFWLASDGGTGADASWYYRNQGDYDLNGEVNIADLTQVGLAFGRKSVEANWEDVQRVDGDGNGEINIADVTPMGQNYGGVLAGFLLETSPTGDAPWTPVSWVPYTAPPPGTEDAPGFTRNIADPGATDYYRVTPTANASEPYAFGSPGPAVQWGATSDAGWNQVGGGPQHLGQSTKNGPIDNNLAWKFPIPGVSLTYLIDGTPVADHFGTSYVATYAAVAGGSGLIDTTGYLHAVDRHGSLVFGRAFPSGLVAPPVVLPNQTIVINDIMGKIWCLSREGVVLWTQQVAGINGDNVSINGITCSPTSNFYITDETPALYKISPDGQILWSVPLSARATCSPCLMESTRVCVGVQAEGVNPTRIYQFQTLDGALLVSSDTPDEVDGRIVYQASEFLMYYHESDELGAVPVGVLAPWTYANPDLQTSASVTWGSDRVVGIGSNSSLVLATGTLVGLDDFGIVSWSRPLAAGVMNEPLIDASDRIYVSTLGGPEAAGIYAIDEDTHDIDWFHPEPGYNSGLCMAAAGLITYVTTVEPVNADGGFEAAQFLLAAIGTP